MYVGILAHSTVKGAGARGCLSRVTFDNMTTEIFVSPVVDRSVGEQVTVEIRRAILSGALKPGQEFSLREIATQLGVSFIPVREALRRLESQGLVIMRPNRSAMVVPLDRDDLMGIYRLRRQIEPELAAASARLHSRETLSALQGIVESFADPGRSPDDLYEAHHNFHLELLRPAATAWDIRTLETLWRAGERYVRLVFGAAQPGVEEHRHWSAAHGELLEAFRARDARRVRRCVRDHLAANEETLLAGIAAAGY